MNAQPITQPATDHSLTHSQLADLVSALRSGPDVLPVAALAADSRAVFVGSGDSLSSALLAAPTGHRALSSGDLAWTGRPPAAADTVVGISHSGSSAATVKALRTARAHGVATVAITSDPSSALAAAADRVQPVPRLSVTEEVPCAGHLMLGLGVAAVTGVDTAGLRAALADALSGLAPLVSDVVARLPELEPSGISVLSLPDLRGAADFWMLKLIEATGVPVRAVPLEESGHVDYFIGPQPHLTLDLVGALAADRHDRLRTALGSTGQHVVSVDLTPVHPDEDQRAATLHELVGAVIGTLVAAAAALRWRRPPFRGGAVNMDASHIKLDEPATT